MKIMIKVNRSFSAAIFAAAATLFVPAGLGLLAPGIVAAAVLPDFTDLVDKVGPAVVNIRTTEKSKSILKKPFYEIQFQPN
jgi:serine protease Do